MSGLGQYLDKLRSGCQCRGRVNGWLQPSSHVSIAAVERSQATVCWRRIEPQFGSTPTNYVLTSIQCERSAQVDLCWLHPTRTILIEASKHKSPVTDPAHCFAFAKLSQVWILSEVANPGSIRPSLDISVGVPLTPSVSAAEAFFASGFMHVAVGTCASSTVMDRQSAHFSSSPLLHHIDSLFLTASL